MQLLLGKIKNLKANQIDFSNVQKETFFLLKPKIHYWTFLAGFSLFLVFFHAFLVFFSVFLGFFRFFIKKENNKLFSKSKKIQAV